MNLIKKNLKTYLPTWLTAELRRKDEDAVVGAIVIIPALLDPGTQLLEEKSDVNDELVTS